MATSKPTSQSTPTRRKKAPNTDGLPTATRAHVVEAASRQILEATLHPWITRNHTPDYGIDTEVEITRQRDGSSDLMVTSLCFAVQLKGTETELPAPGVPFRIDVTPTNLRYWFNRNQPVLLVVCHTPTKRLFWRWMDDRYASELSSRNPGWIGQQTVSVDVPTTPPLTKEVLPQLDDYVSGFRRSGRAVVAPGSYFLRQSQTDSIAAHLATLAEGSGIESVPERLRDLHRQLRASTYVVAITGPARVGKSTLLNVLLRRALSPVGTEPTTAVPIVTGAGASDLAEIAFQDGRTLSGDATPEFLAEYATQELNEDNRHGVRLITIRLVNEFLERGIAYLDVPGLYDPSAQIREITELGLQGANALIYVLDVSPAVHGGFHLPDHVIKDLQRLRSSARRLFMVLNKADALGKEHVSALNAYIERQLRKYDLWDRLPDKPIFFSAKHAWESIDPPGDTLSLAALEEHLWGHLLPATAPDSIACVGHCSRLPPPDRNFFLFSLLGEPPERKPSGFVRRSLFALKEGTNSLLFVDGNLLSLGSIPASASRTPTRRFSPNFGNP